MLISCNMREFRGLIALFVIVCLINQNAANAGRTLTKSYVRRDARITFDTNPFLNESITYAACDNFRDQPEIACEIVSDANILESNSKQDSCNILIKSLHQNGTISQYVRVVPLGQERTIVMWLDKEISRFKVGSIHMPSCTMDTPKIEIDNTDDFLTFELLIVPYENSYDVAYKLTKGRKLYKRITVDVLNDRVSKPVRWFRGTNRLAVIPVVMNSPVKGHLVIDYKHKGTKVSLVNANGKFYV